MSRIIVPRRDLILPNRHKQGGFIINPYRFGGGGGGGSDPHWASVVSLLHFDGANGSAVITDQTGLAWTSQGTAPNKALLSTTKSKFGGSSLRLTGGAGCHADASNANFAFGSGDFTIEAWINPDNVTTDMAFLANWRGVNAASCAWIFYVTSAGKLQFSYGVGTLNTGTPTSSSISANVWTHAAVCRQGGTLSYFINGVKDSVVPSISGALNFYSGEPVVVGAISVESNISGSLRYAGYVDEVRVTKGIARYTATFTPPAAPFPNS